VKKSALAIFAHPDDIEFVAAGTMLLLAEAGYDLHYFLLCSGNCGAMDLGPMDIRGVREGEARKAAEILGAQFYGSITDDLELVYSVENLRKVTAVVRRAQPDIVLTHSPQDYMEDHMNASRLAVTAAFAREIPNFYTDPVEGQMEGEVAVYHAMPHQLIDQLRKPIVPDFLIDTGSVHPRKRKALAAHASQKDWLDRTQGMDSYIQTMDELSLQVGNLTGKPLHAEGWRRHSHMGFSAKPDFDPLADALSAFYYPHSQTKE
jgi:LmbE family N-acetylglucosaminyl deacetylase